MNKYDDFYLSLIEFMIKAGLSTTSSFKGTDEREISDFEIEMNFSLPTAYKAYMKYFGHGLGHKGENNEDFSFDTIRAARVANEEDNAEAHIKISSLKSQQILLISHLEYNGTYQFIVSEEIDNPYIYFCEYDPNPVFTVVHTDKSYIFTFTNTLRNTLFGLISLEFYKYKYTSEEWKKRGNNLEISLENISWANVYQEIYKKEKDITGFLKLRKSFCSTVTKIEQMEDRIYTIDEFEWAFIEHYENLGNWLPDHENPYKKI